MQRLCPLWYSSPIIMCIIMYEFNYLTLSHTYPQDLMNQLSTKVEELQQTNAELLKNLTTVTTRWRDICIENCSLRADLLLARSIW